jgi:hypothetical protein
MITVCAVYARDDKTKADTIKTRIENKSFTFIAQFALPMKGRLISLSSSFDVRVSGDTVTAYLPYYGEVHSASVGSDGEIKFTSVHNKYSVTPKKNGWNLFIKPDDIRYSIELYFDISKSGNVMLRVNDYRRDPISFKGYLDL